MHGVLKYTPVFLKMYKWISPREHAIGSEINNGMPCSVWDEFRLFTFYISVKCVRFLANDIVNNMQSVGAIIGVNNHSARNWYGKFGQMHNVSLCRSMSLNQCICCIICSHDVSSWIRRLCATLFVSLPKHIRIWTVDCIVHIWLLHFS